MLVVVAIIVVACLVGFGCTVYVQEETRQHRLIILIHVLVSSLQSTRMDTGFYFHDPLRLIPFELIPVSISIRLIPVCLPVLGNTTAVF